MLKKRNAIATVTAIMVILLMLFIELCIQSNIKQSHAMKTSEFLLEQMITVLGENDETVENSKKELMDSIIVRAKAVAYMLDYNSIAETNFGELGKIAELANVDEVNIFDETGTIYGSSVPKYIGYNFDSGEQMSFFKPMLEDRKLTMCQDIVPNTVDGKSMMYAITWNQEGTKMVQVGIRPYNFYTELGKHDIDRVIAEMPMYEGYDIIVANPDSGIVIGATDKSWNSKYLREYGISLQKASGDNMAQKVRALNGDAIYCSMKITDRYAIVVAYNPRLESDNIALSVLIVFMYLALAGFAILFTLDRLFAVDEQRRYQLSTLTSLSEIYYSLHVIDLKTNSVVEYTGVGEVAAGMAYTKGQDAIVSMRYVMNHTLEDDWKEEGIEFSDLRTIRERMKGRKLISRDLMGKHVGWFRMNFVTMETDDEGYPTKIICASQVIDEEKKREIDLYDKSNKDALTQCLNRRAFEDNVLEYNDTPFEDDFVIISMDVNGLKTINDSLGHDAGDELIVGAATCMKICFGNFGRLFRVGGDEFVAIIFAEEKKLAEIMEDFRESLLKWNGKLVSDITVSCGVVTKKEYPGYKVTELLKVADQRMYEEKHKFYQASGVDRRGQSLATNAIGALYAKILRINITDDTYHIISMDTTDQTAEKGFDDTISGWLTAFGHSGQIHEEDVAMFLERTNIEYMRSFFKEGNSDINFAYRRKTEDGYKKVVMDIVRCNDYTNDDQKLFLYVRYVDE